MFEILGYLTIGLIPGLIVVDWAIRGRKHDSTRFWRVRATVVTLATFYLAGYFAVFWGSLLGDYHLFDLSGLGTFTGITGRRTNSTGCGVPVTKCTTAPKAWTRSGRITCIRSTRSTSLRSRA
jgi:hypothetical protein